jgi:hypothetical protein
MTSHFTDTRMLLNRVSRGKTSHQYDEDEEIK